MLRQRLVHLLLAFLLLSQYAGLSHVVSHVASDIAVSASTPSDAPGSKHLPSDLQCAACLSFTALSSALPTAALVLFAALLLFRVAKTVPAFDFLPPAIRSFDSRAPPSLF
jgi:hypothetical protein